MTVFGKMNIIFNHQPVKGIEKLEAENRDTYLAENISK